MFALFILPTYVLILGDSGYPQRPWMMTPILEAADGSPEANYNLKHRVARVVIENVFGRLKNRWRCLCKDRVLHYKPLKCAQIIQACCVLHNIALDFSVPDLDRYEGCHYLYLQISSAFNVSMSNNELSYYYFLADAISAADPEIFREPRATDRNTTDLIRGRAMRAQLVRRLLT